ncbi:MAG: DUF401 family protein [Defluviitaleaceae bacterium]|nr:DUF401 family protein [Defluviitaleaceae bacterium]
MFQLTTVVLSFALVPVLDKFKLGLWASLMAAAAAMAFINGFSPMDFVNIFITVFTAPNSQNAIFTITAVTIMGTMMKVYGVLDKIVEGLSAVVHDKRYLIIIIPLLIGCLAVPGGAILSAPFILNLGNELGMEKSTSAAANLVFRHMAMFALPYSASILLASSITGIGIMTFIPLNSVFIIPTFIAGYFIYLRKVPPKINEEKVPFGPGIKQVLLYTSPIYVCVIVHMVTGLPLYVSMVSSLIILFFMSPDKQGYGKLFFKSIGFKTIFAAVGVFMIQGVVSNLDGMIAIFNAMFETGTFMLLAIFLASVFFGLITGFHMASISIVIPMLMTLELPMGQFMALMYFAYCAAYFGYYFSPLHMCQIFTNEYMGVKIQKLYKVYRPYVAFMFIHLIVSYFALSYILPLIFG